MLTFLDALQASLHYICWDFPPSIADPGCSTKGGKAAITTGEFYDTQISVRHAIFEAGLAT